MTPTAARRARLAAHLLQGSALSPTDVVARAGALQGQDLGAVLRAVAIRSRPGTTLDDVRAAFDRGELVRSWPMRGTLFATTPTHLAALLAATGERMQRAAARRRQELGLDDTVLGRSRDALLAALDERPRTRAEALAIWEDTGIGTTGGRGYHLLAHHAIDGQVHWGPFASSGKEQLLTRTSPRPVEDPQAALVDVVRGYVRARGPVTEADLAWWTKLPLGVLRPVRAMLDDVVEVDLNGTTAWVVDGAGAEAGAVRPHGSTSEQSPSGVLLVPAFDEWILGYQDRSLVASDQMQDALVPGRNGVFRPAVLVGGVAVGTWHLRPGKDRSPEATLVEKVPAATRRAIDGALSAWPHR